jgi:hypothetical protein
VTANKNKLVLSLNPETQSYKPAGHNLTPEEALEQTRKLQSEGLRGLIVDQDEHHRALTFHRCTLCKKAADAATQSDAQGTHAQRQPEDLASAAAVEESESE